jgi:hypothetical protein
VSVSTDAQNRITKLTPSDKIRIKKSINAGGAFIKLYLGGLACLWDYPDYNSEIAEFVEDPDQIKDICMKTNAPQRSASGSEYRVSREVCSQVSLQNFKIENGSLSLTYLMVEVGTTNTFSDTAITTFNSENSGKKVKLTLSVNLNDKVYSFIPEDEIDDVLYTVILNTMVGYEYLPDSASQKLMSAGQMNLAVQNNTTVKQIKRQSQVCK